MELSVVIPVYGCKNSLMELYTRLKESVNQITGDYEIILVNDNCPQNSWEIIEKICREDKKVIGIELSKNFGQMKAILAGLEMSRGDYVVVMDCDLQDKPEEISKLWNKIKEGYDIVFARREKRKDKKLKIIISKLFYKIYSICTDVKYDSSLCNFSICKRNVIENYCKLREEHRAYVMYLQWMGFKQAVVNVEHNERKEGKSSYNMKKRLKMAGDIIFSQSDKLLRIIVKLGFLITFFSLVAIVAIIINYFVSDVNAGWPSIMSTVFFMSGIIISVIGIVGIYIGNIFVQVKERPLYIARNVLNYNKEGEDC